MENGSATESTFNARITKMLLNGSAGYDMPAGETHELSQPDCV